MVKRSVCFNFYVLQHIFKKNRVFPLYLFFAFCIFAVELIKHTRDSRFFNFIYSLTKLIKIMLQAKGDLKKDLRTLWRLQSRLCVLKEKYYPFGRCYPLPSTPDSNIGLQLKSAVNSLELILQDFEF